jgi:Protein of unknown function (DUF3303)
MQQYMVVERFKPGCGQRVYERFRTHGRMLPHALFYENSWVDESTTICFQLMRTNDASLFQPWFERWSDLVDFEVFPLRSE